MATITKKEALKWILVTLALTGIVGCSPSSSDSSQPPSQVESTSQAAPPPEETPPFPPSPSQTVYENQTLLVNMRQLAEHGKVINSDFPVKSIVIEDVMEKWGKPDKTDWVAAAKGTYATYSEHAIVFGYNKGSQIFEVRSFDKHLKNLSLATTKEVYGTPAYDVRVNGEEIIGYTAGSEFKIEFVFPEPTNTNSNPMMDHYLVLYPRGTVNSMADDPGREW